MKKWSMLLAGLTVFAVISCKDGKKKEAKSDNQTSDQEMVQEEVAAESDNDVKIAKVEISAKSDSDVAGEIIFTEENGKVKLEGNFSGLNPDGEKAIHIHEKGDCSSDDGTSAGGHWNPNDTEHGKWNAEDGYHAGDIGNLEVNEDGTASITFETDQWCIDCDDEGKNIVGKAIIIHEAADDFETQPTGDAGGRVGCGVIEVQ